MRLKAAREVIKAYQALADSEPPPADPAPLAEPQEELTHESLRELTQSCITRLMDGSMNAPAAQMLPSYLRLPERLEEEEDGFKRREEEDLVGAICLIQRTMDRDPTGDPLLQTFQLVVGQMLEAAGGDIEAVARGLNLVRDYGGGESNGS